MKKYLFLLLLSFSQMAFAQQNCGPGITHYTYPSGVLDQTLSTSGAFLTSENGFSAYNLLIQDKPVSLIYAAGIWLGGIDSTGESRFSGTTYVSSNNKSDWSPGPILRPNGVSEAENCKNWDRFFVITREELLTTIALMYNGDGTVNYNNCDKIPASVLSWPGTSNPQFEGIFGFELPDYTQADFYDHNTDGIYDPCRGDLPILKPYPIEIENVEDVIATFPDRLALNIINDSNSTRPLSDGKPINMEIYQTAFDYHTQDSLETTTFYNHKLIYVGAEKLYKSKFSLWIDPDLGCYLDDYVGTSSAHNMVYFYNIDATDGSPADYCNGSSTFGSEIPITGLSYLDGFDYIDFEANPQGWKRSGLTSSIYLNNCSVGSVEPITCDPIGPDSNYYIKMTGKWDSNTPITKGGTGFDPGSTDSTRFVFDGNPADAMGWNMCNAGLPPSDLRMLMTTGDAILEPGAIDHVLTAIQTVPNVQHPCPDIQPLIDLNKAANNFKNRGWRRNSTTSQSEQIMESNLPWELHQVNNGFVLKNKNESSILSIYDLSGKTITRKVVLPHQQLNWQNENLPPQIIIINISTGNFNKSYKKNVY